MTACRTSGAEIASRLDVALVRRGLARSRGHALDLIRSGAVLVDGSPVGKAATQVGEDADVVVSRDGPVWVSRAAAKLVGALDAFADQGLQVQGRRCLDVGACTGGFTQVLLHHGAAEVIALDVGTAQLAGELVVDPRVRDLSGTTVRGLTAQDIGGPVDLLVADLSFISVTLVMSTLAGLVTDRADLVVLVKPQFEVGRGGLDKRGVVRSDAARARALSDVLHAAEAAGLHGRGLVPSPIRGGEGNREYLLWMTSAPDVGVSWEALRAIAQDLSTEGE